MAEHSIAKLIRKSKQSPVRWVIKGLWQEGGIAVVHSLEEEFKSVFTYQIAEAVASGKPLLRIWGVPKKRRVGIFETEMDDLETGRRLNVMYPTGDFPESLVVSDSELIREFRSRQKLSGKMDCVDAWVKAQSVDVLVWDTVNSILASTGDPNSEVAVSRFFDELALLNLKGSLLVRHDSKPTRDNAVRASNQLVRGSNRIVEDASLVLHLKRQDKASHKVRLEVGKLRNSRKPDPMELWFDAQSFRLTPLPPVAALLEQGPLTREELLRKGNRRFGLKSRAMDEQRQGMGNYLEERMDGHKRVLSLRREGPLESDSPVARWWRLLEPQAPSGEVQGCISIGGIPQEEIDGEPDDVEFMTVFPCVTGVSFS
jgi:hypothetical protein